MIGNRETTFVNELTGSTGCSIRNNSLSVAERRNRYAGIGVLASLILYAFFVDPDKVTWLRCSFREWTGWNCFACGLSHSLHASAHLDWPAAVKYHLFGPILFLIAWVVSACWILEIALGRKIPVRIPPGKTRFVFLFTALVWLVYWLSRLFSDLPGTGF